MRASQEETQEQTATINRLALQQPAINTAQRQHLDIHTGVLRALSYFNILFFFVSAGLEIAGPYLWEGIWGSSMHMIAGLIGLRATYGPTKRRLIRVVVFSSLSVVFAIIVILLSYLGFNYCVYEIPKPDNPNFSCDYFNIFQVMVMTFNCFAFADSVIVIALVSHTLCCVKSNSQPTTYQITYINNAPVTTSTSHFPPTSTANAVSPSDIQFLSISSRPELEALGQMMKNERNMVQKTK